MTYRYSELLVAAASALALLASGAVKAQDADAVHRRALVLDGHADVLLPSTPRRYYLPDGGSRVDLDHLTRGGVDAIVLSVAVGPGPRDAAGVRDALAEAEAKLEKIKAFAADNPERVGIALSADDVQRLVGEGKVAVLIGFQNARSIGADLSQIDAFYREGVRVFAFNHAGHNDFSDSSRPGDAPVAEHHGLSPVGRQAVARLNDLGILIDVSQLSSEALAQTLALTRAPVAATHSNARARIENTRNLTDAELDAIKANGGIVQLTPFNSYLVQPDAAARERVSAVRIAYGLSPDFASANDGYGGLGDRQQAFLDALAPLLPKATLADYVDQLDYVAKRIGWEHVGVGSDFDHGAGVIGFDSAADAPNVTRELLRRGYTQAQIDAIWGGNFLRVLRAAEAARRT
ncbi:dipeptidase [Brevundimonas intermedia]|uniref:Dipeptidase n=1 Tax=Brevundimonas intermedia TaxID=74315 RepID=A0ABQ5T7D2_9CAUL|nr:dipeptidase [Brevundimonas intermedia]GLK47681.1 dipeptidase [Brevundimonas intermedia]